jgi:hypothetical protein
MQDVFCSSLPRLWTQSGCFNSASVSDTHPHALPVNFFMYGLLFNFISTSFCQAIGRTFIAGLIVSNCVVAVFAAPRFGLEALLRSASLSETNYLK